MSDVFNLLTGETEQVQETEENYLPEKYKFDLFGTLNSISNKDYSFDSEHQSSYPPYMINRGLMQNLDTILYANEMNMHSQVTKEMHYDYLFYSVSKKKRYGKWAKASTDNKELVDRITEYYKINRKYALQYIKMVGEEEIKKHLDKKMYLGGKIK